MVGVDAALDYPAVQHLRPSSRARPRPTRSWTCTSAAKQIERDILSSHGDATRFFVTFLDNHDMKERIRYVDPADPPGSTTRSPSAWPACIHCRASPASTTAPNRDCTARQRPSRARGPLGRAGLSTQTTRSTSRSRAGRDARRAPALRYGRFYFRPVSGDGATSASPLSPGRAGLLPHPERPGSRRRGQHQYRDVKGSRSK